jgi:hypothetical protein
MTTPAQQTANQRNGRLSKGPVTGAGKATSSRNATTHGAYRQHPGPVLTGPFAENPDTVADTINEVVRGLRPRDELEERLAVEVAEIFLDIERANAYKIASLAAPPTTPRRRRDRAGDPVDSDIPVLADTAQLMDRLSNALRIKGMAYRQLRTAKAEYDRLQQRTLESAIGFTGDLDVDADPVLSPLENARVQAHLWRCRTEYLEAEQERHEYAADIDLFLNTSAPSTDATSASAEPDDTDAIADRLAHRGPATGDGPAEPQNRPPRVARRPVEEEQTD